MNSISYINVCEAQSASRKHENSYFLIIQCKLKYKYQFLYLHSILSIKFTVLSSTHPRQLSL